MSIIYYSNYNDAFTGDKNFMAQQINSWIIGDNDNIQGSIGSYTSWRIARMDVGAIPPPTDVFQNGYNLEFISIDLGITNFYLYPSAPCFLEGTKILCQIDGVDKYIPIETMTTNTLVKTSRDGYKKVEIIGKGIIKNPGTNERIENRLYKCSPENYPELKYDLYITGCHSILVNSLTDIEREMSIKQLGKIFVTDKKYRLTAFVDERAKPWNLSGTYTIWHIALENENDRMNYGIYVNGGLLIETCSINMLKNKSNMNIF